MMLDGAEECQLSGPIGELVPYTYLCETCQPRPRGGALSLSPPPGRGGRRRGAPPRRARAPRMVRSALRGRAR